ncbi:MAG TPA: hypothetical protein VGS08_01375 [Candidatus Saccharimonadales bacterium]|nr:hypothetical protein [Candidatus Saccharimonadales bacterium]
MSTEIAPPQVLTPEEIFPGIGDPHAYLADSSEQSGMRAVALLLDPYSRRVVLDDKSGELPENRTTLDLADEQLIGVNNAALILGLTSLALRAIHPTLLIREALNRAVRHPNQTIEYIAQQSQWGGRKRYPWGDTHPYDEAEQIYGTDRPRWPPDKGLRFEALQVAVGAYRSRMHWQLTANPRRVTSELHILGLHPAIQACIDHDSGFRQGIARYQGYSAMPEPAAFLRRQNIFLAHVVELAEDPPDEVLRALRVPHKSAR